LDAGKRLLLLSLPGLNLMNPGVRLGWWGTSGQTGTAIARHAAFGNFPHEGFLNQLFFRLVGNAEKLDAGHAFAGVEPLMVGTGREFYIFGSGETDQWRFNLYAFQANASKGKVLSSGLNLAAEFPEAVCLLDQFLNYAKSDQFQPRGAFDLQPWREAAEKRAQLRRDINGFAELMPSQAEARPYLCFVGTLPMRIVRQTTGNDVVTWQTRPTPKELKSDVPYTFRWLVSTGYKSQPAGGHFTLYVDGKELLRFDVAFESRDWSSGDGRVKLAYEVKRVTEEDSDGIMALTVPGGWLRPGEPAQLEVRGSAAISQRHFGLYEFP
jgi:hypothetical protein